MTGTKGQRIPESRRGRSSRDSRATRPEIEGSQYFTHEDIEMNEDIHGIYTEDLEADYDGEGEYDNYDEETEDADEYEDSDHEDEEFEDSTDQEQEETMSSSEYEGAITPSVKDIVHNINHIAFGHVERGKLEIGGYVLRVVFNDNIEDVLSKNPNKKESLRQICDDEELRVDRRRLSNWIRAAAYKRDLEAHGVDCSKMLTSQLVALLRVKDEDKRRELAGTVSTEKLSVRNILDEADLLNQNGNPKDAARILRKKIENPLSLLKDTDAVALLRDEHRLAEEIPYKDRTEIITRIDELAEQIEESKTFLDEIRDNLFLVDMERLRNRKS